MVCVCLISVPKSTHNIPRLKLRAGTGRRCVVRQPPDKRRPPSETLMSVTSNIRTVVPFGKRKTSCVLVV